MRGRTFWAADLISGAELWEQALSRTIVGTVTDQAGDVAPGAIPLISSPARPRVALDAEPVREAS